VLQNKFRPKIPPVMRPVQRVPTEYGVLFYRAVMILSTGPYVQHQTLATETGLFRRRLAALREVVAVLMADSGAHQLHKQTCVALDHRLNSLAQNVAKEGNLNACGKFEWIDSVLVKVSVSGATCNCY
jgi:hypothetical protein